MPRTHTQDELRQIGDLVRRTRVARGLDKEAAARDAGVNSITWKKVEDAEPVRDASLGKVLSSLRFPDSQQLLHDVAVTPHATATGPNTAARGTRFDALQAAVTEARAVVLGISQEALRVDHTAALDTAAEVSTRLSELASELARAPGNADPAPELADETKVGPARIMDAAVRAAERMRTEQPQHGGNEGA